MKPQWKEVPQDAVYVDPNDLSDEALVRYAHTAARWAAGQAGVVIGPLADSTGRVGPDLSVSTGQNLTLAYTWVAAGSVPGNPTPFRLLSVGICGLRAYWDVQSWDDAEWATGLVIAPPPPV